MLTAMVGTVVDPGSGHSIMNIVSWYPDLRQSSYKTKGIAGTELILVIKVYCDDLLLLLVNNKEVA